MVTVVETFFAVLALMAAPVPDTLDVPAEHATIQAAIGAALAGDTILVAPGTYAETIDFLGKDITVESSAGAAATTIDGAGLGGSVVTFAGGETTAAVLRGFTLTGGSGSDPIGSLGYAGGGGIVVIDAKPTVEDCIATGNAAAGGGGVLVQRSSFLVPPAGLVMTDCMLTGNTASGDGGGLSVQGTAGTVVTLTDCTLSSNTASSGGGFMAANGANLTCTRCLITENIANGAGPLGEGGGGVWRSSPVDSGYGPLVLVDCTLSENHADGDGGGLYAETSSDGLVGAGGSLTRCRIVGNTAGGKGGGVWAAAHDPVFVLRDCLLAQNTSDGQGGGIYRGGNVPLRNTTVVENTTAATGGGLYDLSGSSIAITGSLFWDNLPNQIRGAVPSAPTWCDIAGGHAGRGNIDAAPLFLDALHGDWRIAPLSPCRDAGDPAFVPWPGELDLQGEARIIDGRVDIGTDEAGYSLDPWTDLAHALGGGFGAPVLDGSGALLGADAATLTLSGAAPTAFTFLFIGLGVLDAPFFYGGFLYPSVDFIIGPFTTSPTGTLVLAGTWPAGIPADTSFFFQYWIDDATAPFGFAGSNAMMATAP